VQWRDWVVVVMVVVVEVVVGGLLRGSRAFPHQPNAGQQLKTSACLRGIAR
jgi:hypothetical protein